MTSNRINVEKEEIHCIKPTYKTFRRVRAKCPYMPLHMYPNSK